jgi:DNA polymerase III subunit gamma/tau
MATRLDLKHRPRRFADVLGNEGVVQLLLKRSRAGTLTDQSMLFGGPKGTGKTTLARIVATAIVCQEKQDGEPCGSCSACLAVLHETSACVEELDAASQGTVDKIREMVRDSEYEAVGGVGNIYIMDEAQRLSLASQDAMLKAVEDRSIIMIMCTTEPHKIKPAIRSRVEEYPVSAPTTEQMAAALAKMCVCEQIQHDPDALPMLAKICQNCPRVCIRAIETMAVSGAVDGTAVRKFLRFGSYEAVDKILATIDDSPKSAIAMFDALIDQEGVTWVRDAMLFAVASGLRIDVGANHSYPCRISFFQTRLRQWSEFARQIGLTERPTSAGILAALLSTKSGGLTQKMEVLPPPAAVAPVVAKPAEKQQEATSAQHPVEIGGVMFTSSEKLTTLDSKINGNEKRDESAKPMEPQGVEYRSDMVPMSDREFAHGFIGRLKKTS